ncbi:MAG TPA: IPT/TIG domain-containing protein [Terriglobales bacterium]|nr:IPT/TIG domain-containing protein [Terriglobales bacterium]
MFFQPSLESSRRFLLDCFCLAAILTPGLVFAASGAAVFPGVELTIPNATVPPGGMLQLQIAITEPKPISKGGQRASFASPLLASPVGISLFSPGGDASGTAVFASAKAPRFTLHSSISDMGNNIDYPILVMAIPVKTTAIPGNIANLVLDPNLSQWLDPNGVSYPVLLTNGILTVGGTLSISNIVPGGGLVRKGAKIAIQGMGFRPDSTVQVNEATIATQTFVNSNEIDVTLTTDFNMTADRVRVKNSNGEQVTYYSYQRTTPLGKSASSLIAATYPLFSQATWSLAYFKPVLSGSQFSGLALQNATATPSQVRLQLFGSNGTLLATTSLTIGAYRRISRALSEFFGVVPGNGTEVKVKVTSGPRVQMLGLLGNTTLGTVDPVDPSPVP